MTKRAYAEIRSVMTSACSSHVANLKFSKKHASEQVWLTFDVCGTFSLPFADQLLIYGTLPLGSVLPVVLSCQSPFAHPVERVLTFPVDVFPGIPLSVFPGIP